MDDFKKIISIILNNWTGLKIAIENGMGGAPNTIRNKLLTLIDTLEDMLVKTKNPSNIEWEPIADTLADFLDDQMDIVFEDESPDEVGRQIVELYKLYITQNQTEILNIINTMQYQTLIVDKLPTQNIVIHEEDTAMSYIPEETQSQEVNDGWTVVKKK